MKNILFTLLIVISFTTITSCSSAEEEEIAQTTPTDPGGGDSNNGNDDNDDGGDDNDGNTTATVFERLVGKVFRQIESPDDCLTCQDEINYYIFSNEGIRITGTTLDGVCEQNDYEQFGDCQDCLTITEDTAEKVTICTVDACQTITFVSETEIKFDFPEANISWEAQLFEEEAPCMEWEQISDGENTVFARLQGNTYKQIESVADCGTCEDEINYYIFSEEGLRITGTTYDDICEQNDFQPIGDCDGCAEIDTNTEDLLTVCVGTFPFRVCQTITFLSDTQIQFDFPAFNQTWTADLYEEDPPCTNIFYPEYDGTFDGTTLSASDDGLIFEFPSSAGEFAGFANSAEIYPLSFPDGGKVTFTGATSGTDIEVFFRFEADVYPNTEPSYTSANITVSGTQATEYTVEIPPQGTNTFNSAIFYLVTRDQPLTASNFYITVD